MDEHLESARDRAEMALEEEQELHGETRAERDRLRAVVEAVRTATGELRQDIDKWAGATVRRRVAPESTESQRRVIHNVLDHIDAQLDGSANMGGRADTCPECGTKRRLARKFNSGNPTDVWMDECDCAERRTDAELARRYGWGDAGHQDEDRGVGGPGVWPGQTGEGTPRATGSPDPATSAGDASTHEDEAGRTPSRRVPAEVSTSPAGTGDAGHQDENSAGGPAPNGVPSADRAPGAATPGAQPDQRYLSAACLDERHAHCDHACQICHDGCACNCHPWNNQTSTEGAPNGTGASDHR
jgi:hypothetical protein